jgi:signal transduction histidine kinase
MKRFLPSSIFGLVAFASLVLTGATVLLGAGILDVAHEAIEQQLDHRIEAESVALLKIFEDEGIAALRAVIEQRDAGRHEGSMEYLLVDRAGRRLAGELRAKVPEPGWYEHLKIDSGFGRRGRAQSLTTLLSDGARLVVAADRKPVTEIDETLTNFVVVTVVSMLIVGIGCAWALGAITQRRLNRINATAQAIIDGDHARRVPRDGTAGEFDRLAETLNRMLDRIGELLDNVRHVSSDIAHDLRTPLTRQQQVLETALIEGQDSEGYRRAIMAAAESGREMLDLFAALLRISEIETFDVRSAFREVDLAEVVERVADAFRPDVEASGRRLDVVVAERVRVQGDRHLLSQLLANLVENATRHTPAGTTLMVTLGIEDRGALLVVEDDGPGIAPGDRERVLRRFARVEKSRTTPGFGIGLSLVAAIARAHFAQLTLADNSPGLRVEIHFAALSLS